MIRDAARVVLEDKFEEAAPPRRCLRARGDETISESRSELVTACSLALELSSSSWRTRRLCPLPGAFAGLSATSFTRTVERLWRTGDECVTEDVSDSNASGSSSASSASGASAKRCNAVVSRRVADALVAAGPTNSLDESGRSKGPLAADLWPSEGPFCVAALVPSESNFLRLAEVFGVWRLPEGASVVAWRSSGIFSSKVSSTSTLVRLWKDNAGQQAAYSSRMTTWI